MSCFRFAWWMTFRRRWPASGYVIRRSELLCLSGRITVSQPFLLLHLFPVIIYRITTDCNFILRFLLSAVLTDTWRKSLRAPSACCPSIMNTGQQAVRKSWNQFTYWLYWMLKLLGLKSGWCVWEMRKCLRVYFCMNHCVCSLSSLVCIAALSTATTAGPWFSDFWRENTSLWWVTHSLMSIFH